MANTLHHGGNRQLQFELAAIALGLCGVISTPARAQEPSLIAPAARMVFQLTTRAALDDSESVAPIQQAYRIKDDRSPVESAIRRVALAAPPPAPWDHPRLVVFAGGGDEALMWSPANNGADARFSYRDDRVELGEIHAGIGLEANNTTLSLGYIEKDYDSRFGSQTESFAGISFAWRQ
jgi:hypothetical protein